jgi:hypothetical protein
LTFVLSWVIIIFNIKEVLMSTFSQVKEENEKRIRGIKGMLDDYETCTLRHEFNDLAYYCESMSREIKALQHNAKILQNCFQVKEV